MPLVDFGARTSLIIYRQYWSESIALAPFVLRVPKNLGFLVHPKAEEKSLDLGKTSLQNLFLVR
jgi:hypothetical protein